MKKALRAAIGPQSFDTWIRPITPLGVVETELYLQLPSPDFQDVPNKYDIAAYLPQRSSSMC
jgi:hypothetical protein